jgi:probable F420-dependent oxidoreductase
MNLSTVGVDALMDSMAGIELAKFGQKIEKLGYSALWFPEAFGRDPFALAAHLLTVTDKLIVGTAIANVWKRGPVAMLSGARTLAELFPGRFVLGIGISHGPMMTRMGIDYVKPLSFMRDYLARLKEAPYSAARPSSEAPIVVAALLPKMLRLAAAETDGTIPTFVTPERTAQIRAEIGPDKLICVQQVSMLETDASKARTAFAG